MYGLSIAHWVVVVAVLVLLFGRGRISALMADIGGGLRELKRAGKELTSAEDTASTELRSIERKMKEPLA
jgi:sec-independent protein translocase protein TatA